MDKSGGAAARQRSTNGGPTRDASDDCQKASLKHPLAYSLVQIGHFRRNGLEEAPTPTIAFHGAGTDTFEYSNRYLAVSVETAWRDSRESRLLL